MMFEHFVKQRPVDFIYSKGYTGWYFIKKKQDGQKLASIAIRLHGYEIFQTSRSLINWYRNKLYLSLIMYLNRNTDYIYSYGGGITDIIKKNIPNSESKIIEVPAGIESEWIFETNTKINSPLRFAFLGRYDIRKGVKELTEALKILVLNNKFEFHFIGPIPDEFKIDSPQIKYHGAIFDAEKIKTILRETDVFVLPSHSEGMPNVILEAMASGCAILATDVGAVNVLVGDDNGWLIPPIDSKALVEKMTQILNSDKMVVEQKKINSVQKVKQHFLWDQVIVKEIEAIKKIIEK